MSYQTDVLALSPKAYWRCNEASGDLADSSGNGYTATVKSFGGGTSAVPVYRQTSLVTSDGDYSVKVNKTTAAAGGKIFGYATASTIITRPYTFAAWVQIPSFDSGVTDSSHTLMKPNNGNACPAFNGSTKKFGFFDGSAWRYTTTVCSNGTTYFVAAAITSNATTGVTLYVNGTQEYQGSGSNTDDGGAGILYLGGRGDGEQYWLSGLIDEIAIFNQALTAQQVWNLYDSGRAAGLSARRSIARQAVTRAATR